jgi:predicted ABC-type ATPase
MSETRLILAVVGPNGSGKSSALYRTEVDEALPFINPDDIARNDFANIPDDAERNRLAWHRCNELREKLVTNGISFGFETVGSHPSKVELLAHAKELGYRVGLLFVATESPDINKRRVLHRVSQGGHPVPDDKIEARYYRTLTLLPKYFEVADTASIWDNTLEADSRNPAIRNLVRKEVDGSITMLPAAEQINWIKTYLLNSYLQRFLAQQPQ